MRPEVSYCEPWHGQYQPPNSPRGSDGFCPSGTQPRCVQTQTRISHSGFLTREASVCGSLRPDGLSTTLPAASSTGSAFLAAAISSGVRWRMKTGLPRHLTVIAWPTWTPEISTSIEDKASTSPDGFMLLMNGQATDAAPNTAAEVAIR